MTPRSDTMIGRVIGRLTVVARAHRDGRGHYWWMCQCACGNTATVSTPNLISGATRLARCERRRGTTSCGCLRRERLVASAQARVAAKTHCVKGHAYTPENVMVRRFRDGSTQRACRICVRDRGRRQYQKHRALLMSLKVKCARCPENHPACLSFHHHDPEQKSFHINLRSTRSLAKILAEFSKGEVLCENCHRKLHYDRRHALREAS